MTVLGGVLIAGAGAGGGARSVAGGGVIVT
jgi:hypothetical protein